MAFLIRSSRALKQGSRGFASMGGPIHGPEAPYIYPEETQGIVPWDRNYWNPQPYRNPKYMSSWPSHHHANIVPVTRMIPDLVDLDAADRDRHAKEAVYAQELVQAEKADREANPEKYAQMAAKRAAIEKSRAQSLLIPRTPSILNEAQLERYSKFWDSKGNPLPGTELPESRLLKGH